MAIFDKIGRKNNNFSHMSTTAANVAAAAEFPVSIHGNKTNIDEVIDNFKQGKTGDCYFLSDLKNLSRKSWGKKVIKDAIKPDNQGGAYVTFKGARGGEQTFHISQEEILRNKGTEDNHKFSFGDDDTLLMELAYEKYKKSIGYPDIDGRSTSAQAEYMIINNTIPRCIDDEIVPLLCGRDTKISYSTTTYGNDLLLQQIKENLDNYVIEIAFEPLNDLNLPDRHALEVIDITTDDNGHPIIILGNPWNSSQRIVRNYYDVISASTSVKVWENPEKHIAGFGDDNIKYSKITDEDREYINSQQKRYHEAHKKDCGGVMKDPEANENQGQTSTGLTIVLANQDPEYQKLANIIYNPDKDRRMTLLDVLLKDTYRHSEEINKMIENEYPDIIKMIDRAEYGWGHGEEKAKLLGKFVEYVAQEARDSGVGYREIQAFKEICNKELNAKIYTNENTIIEAFRDMYTKINKWKNSEQSQDGYENSLVQNKKGYDKIEHIINNYKEGHRISLLKDYLLDFYNSKEVGAVVQKRYKDIIKLMDSAESGWGHGEEKKNLMDPLIYFVKMQASEAGVAESDINKFTETCYKELNAKLYTNENTIIKAFDEIYQKINTAKRKK